MNIKEEINKIVKRISSDKSLLEEFKKEPIKAIEKVLDVDLPDDVLEQVVVGVKAKLAGESISDKVSSVTDSLKKLF